jgi:multiple sugar transport system substrate-binding protein
MALNRRQFLIGAGGLAAAATTMGLSACAPGSSGGGSQGGDQGGGTNLALAWWGNPTRNKNTQAMIDAYMKANPDVKISGQPGEFNSYWDKLATQTAGGQATRHHSDGHELHRRVRHSRRSAGSVQS